MVELNLDPTTGKATLKGLSFYPKFSECINNSIILKPKSPQEILAVNPNRVYALIQNNGSHDLTLTFAGKDLCVFGQGILLRTGGNYEINLMNLYQGALSAIAEFDCSVSYVECISS